MSKNYTPTNQNGLYVFSLELAKITSDPITVGDQIFHIYITGRDTTAAKLILAMHFLARKPDVFNKHCEGVLNHIEF